MAKDRFSSHAQEYSRFRPDYPKNLYESVLDQCNHFDRAWDCGTGNGQVAFVLSKYFKKVEATDISKEQIKYAKDSKNIKYSVRQAENTLFTDSQFDLITVAQAIHWFDLDSFYSEVDRVLRKDGIFAVWGYGLIEFENSELNRLVQWFYKDVTGPYWDKERVKVHNHYKDIEFPYPILPSNNFRIDVEYSIEDLLNFLSTWSSVKNYKEQTGSDPIALLQDQLARFSYERQRFKGNFPGFLYVMRKQ